MSGYGGHDYQEGQQKTLRQWHVDLARRLAEANGMMTSYEIGVRTEKGFHSELVGLLNQIESTLDVMKVAFLKDKYKKGLLDFSAYYHEARKTTGWKGSKAGLDIGMRRQEAKRELETRCFAVNAYFNDLAKIFLDNNFFEDNSYRIGADDIVEE